MKFKAKSHDFYLRLGNPKIRNFNWSPLRVLG